MTCDAIGIAGTLYLYRTRVRIVAGRFAVTHERKFMPGEGSTLPEHRAPHVAAVSGKRAKRSLQREQLLKLGPEALAYLTELTHRRPQIWLRDIDRLHTLLATCGDDAMRAALARGVHERAIGAEYIAHFLANAVTTPMPIEGDSLGHTVDRSSVLGHPGQSSLASEPPLFDLTSANAITAPRGARVEAAAGARRAGAKRRASTRASTALPFEADGGRSCRSLIKRSMPCSNACTWPTRGGRGES
ncbi:MAG: hypothetical protein ACT4QD_14485 [Acidobacteriota bacterium]